MSDLSQAVPTAEQIGHWGRNGQIGQKGHIRQIGHCGQKGQKGQKGHKINFDQDQLPSRRPARAGGEVFLLTFFFENFLRIFFEICRRLRRLAKFFKFFEFFRFFGAVATCGRLGGRLRALSGSTVAAGPSGRRQAVFLAVLSTTK